MKKKEWRRKKAFDKGYSGFGENDISGDGVFVFNKTMLPLQTEMKSKEFFTLQEWR